MRSWSASGLLGGLALTLLATAVSAQPVETAGRNVRLDAALPRIVPEGVTVRLEAPELGRRPITWNPGPEWRAVLGAALHRVGLRLREEGGAFVVEGPPLPLPPPPASPSPPSGAEAAARRRTPPASAAAAPRSPAPERAAPAAAADGPGVWRARRGQTLDQVLAEWCERAGWTLVFNSALVYELQAGVELRGDFIDAAASLIGSIQARPLPRATFWRGNRVLVVANSFEEERP